MVLELDTERRTNDDVKSLWRRVNGEIARRLKRGTKNSF